MRKTLYRPENDLLRDQLRRSREALGVTQQDLSAALGKSQTFVSDVERGVRRLDTVELWEICRALGIDFVAFAAEFRDAAEALQERRVPAARKTGKSRRR